MNPTTHDTFVIGVKKGRICFIKSYSYKEQQAEAQSDLKFVQDNEDQFDQWYISHAGQWILLRNDVRSELPITTLPINIPMPDKVPDREKYMLVLDKDKEIKRLKGLLQSVHQAGVESILIKSGYDIEKAQAVRKDAWENYVKENNLNF